MEPRRLSVEPPAPGGAKNQIFMVTFFYLNLSKPLVFIPRAVYYVLMSTIYSYDEFLVFVAQEHHQLKAGDPTVRLGQTYFNCLWEFRPSIANAIRATKYDPFHKEEVHPDIHVHVNDMWDEMNTKVLSGE